MDPSADARSLVRGWLRAFPCIGIVRLTPPSLVPAFSPRPERLGLGAVPPQDPDTYVYNSKLEKRIKRKLLGKRSRDDDDDAVDCISVDKKGSVEESSDELCSRSTITHSKSYPSHPTGDSSTKKSRKRKRKKHRLTASSVATLITSDGSTSVCDVSEDPVPHKRTDLLRGGAQQNMKTLAKYPARDHNPLPAAERKGCSIKGADIQVPVERHVVLKRRKRQRNHCWLRCRQSLPWPSPFLRHRLRRLHHQSNSQPKF